MLFKKKKVEQEEKDVLYYEFEEDKIEINIYRPSSFKEIEEIGKIILKDKKIKLDLSNLNDNDKKKALLFLSGMMFGLEKKIVKIENDLFLIDIR